MHIASSLYKEGYQKPRYNQNEIKNTYTNQNAKLKIQPVYNRIQI